MILDDFISPMWFSEPKGGRTFLLCFLALGWVGQQVLAAAAHGSCWLPYRSMNSFLAPPWLRREHECCPFQYLLIALLQGLIGSSPKSSVFENIKHSYEARQGFGWGGTGWGPPCLPFSGGKLLREWMPCSAHIRVPRGAIWKADCCPCHPPSTSRSS